MFVTGYSSLEELTISVEKSPDDDEGDKLGEGGGSGGGLTLGRRSGGGGGGGGPGSGRSLKAGIPARKFAASQGFSQRSLTPRLVGWEEQLKR